MTDLALIEENLTQVSLSDRMDGVSTPIQEEDSDTSSSYHTPFISRRRSFVPDMVTTPLHSPKIRNRSANFVKSESPSMIFHTPSNYTTPSNYPVLSTARRAEKRYPSLGNHLNSQLESPNSRALSKPKNESNYDSSKFSKRTTSCPVDPNASYLRATQASINRIRDVGKENLSRVMGSNLPSSSPNIPLSDRSPNSLIVNKVRTRKYLEDPPKVRKSSINSRLSGEMSIQPNNEQQPVIDDFTIKRLNRRSMNFGGYQPPHNSTPLKATPRKISIPLSGSQSSSSIFGVPDHPKSHHKTTTNSSVSIPVTRMSRSSTLQSLNLKVAANPTPVKRVISSTHHNAISGAGMVPTSATKLHASSNTTMRTSPTQSSRNNDKINDGEELYQCLLTHPSTEAFMKNRILQNEPSTPSRNPIEIVDKTNNLNIYEKGEILKKEKIYFTGISKKSKPLIDISNYNSNFGFDDKERNYIANIGDHIDYRYEIVDRLGSGSFGSVLKCKDHENGNFVAIKIIKNDMAWSLQAVYEIKMLKILTHGKFILDYMNHFHFRGHMCISTELLSVNLYQALEASNFKGFGIRVIQNWCKQILSGLEYIHQKGIIHCDLKHENIMLVDPNSLEIKLIDFGAACYENEISYSYIQSRFYRAPEILLGARYDCKIDIWSFGCIMIELFTGDPILPGKDEIEQIGFILEIFGVPSSRSIIDMRRELEAKGPVDKSERALVNMKRVYLYSLFDTSGKLKLEVLNQRLVKKRIRPNSKSLDIILQARGLDKKRDGDSFLRFLKNIMCWDPKMRHDSNRLLKSGFLTEQDEDAFF